MQEMWVKLQAMLQGNQFLSGGVMMAMMYGIMAWCRSLPNRIIDLVRRYFTIEVEIEETDECFLWLVKWLSDHRYSKERARILQVRVLRDRDNPDGLPIPVFVPGIGSHWFFHRGRFISLSHNREGAGGGSHGGAAGGGSQPMSSSLFKRESYVLRVYTRNRQFVIDLFAEAFAANCPSTKEKIRIMQAAYDRWHTIMYRPCRPLSSVVLAEGMAEEIETKINRFKEREQWYLDRHIPWRFGLLLEGPPGGGKSSLAMALAAHFRLDIALLNLRSRGIDDDTLSRVIAALPKDTLLLLEDVDCICPTRRVSVSRPKSSVEGVIAIQGDDEKVSLAGLLNAIDGVPAGEGRVLVMTTNHPERLDSALIRPGRVDLAKHIGAPTADQVYRLTKRFFQEAREEELLEFAESAAAQPKISMAALQNHLITYADIGLSDAITNVAEMASNAEAYRIVEEDD